MHLSLSESADFFCGSVFYYKALNWVDLEPVRKRLNCLYVDSDNGDNRLVGLKSSILLLSQINMIYILRKLGDKKKKKEITQILRGRKEGGEKRKIGKKIWGSKSKKEVGRYRKREIK